MAEEVSLAMLRQILIGRVVNRDPAVLPATAQAPIFTVRGGRVMILLLMGECTTVCSATATNLKVTGNPTVGTDVDLCANSAIASKEVGTLAVLSGLNSDALVVLNAGGAPGPVRPAIVNKGSIDLVTSATNTGAFKWTIGYLPIDDGAEIVAA